MKIRLQISTTPGASTTFAVRLDAAAYLAAVDPATLPANMPILAEAMDPGRRAGRHLRNQAAELLYHLASRHGEHVGPKAAACVPVLIADL